MRDAVCSSILTYISYLPYLWHPKVGNMLFHPGSCISAGEVRIPVISLSTWKTSAENLEVALNSALELGYRRIRVGYGVCEELGPILKKCFESGKIKREDLFISAKLPPVGTRYEDVDYFLTKTLENLEMDYLDLFEIGSPIGFARDGDTLAPTDDNGDILLDLKTDIVETWKGMEEEVVAGRARSIGLTCCNRDQVARILDNCTIKPVNLSIELHVYLQMKELVSFCKKNGIALTAVAPFGCPGLEDVLSESDENKKTISSPLKDPVIIEIARKHKKKPSQVVLRFLMEYGATLSIKSVNQKRLKDCLDIFDFELNHEEFERMSALDLGEEGRRIGGSCSTGIFKILKRHPEYPWKK